MEELFYTKDNYWVIIENDIATIGLSNYLIDNMNVINYIELPNIGAVCSKTDILGIINYNEDEKLELYSPFTGEIVDVNDSISDNCEQLFSRDTDNTWLFRIYVTSKEDFNEELMSEEEYKDFIENDGI